MSLIERPRRWRRRHHCLFHGHCSIIVDVGGDSTNWFSDASSRVKKDFSTENETNGEVGIFSPTTTMEASWKDLENADEDHEYPINLKRGS